MPTRDDKCAMHDTCFQSLERQYSEMEKKMDDLKEDIRMLSAKIDKWTSGFAVHGSQISGLDETLKWLKKKYENMEAEIGKLKYKIAALSAGVSILVSLLFIYIKSKGL